MILEDVISIDQIRQSGKIMSTGLLELCYCYCATLEHPFFPLPIGGIYCKLRKLGKKVAEMRSNLHMCTLLKEIAESRDHIMC